MVKAGVTTINDIYYEPDGLAEACAALGPQGAAVRRDLRRRQGEPGRRRLHALSRARRGKVEEEPRFQRSLARQGRWAHHHSPRASRRRHLRTRVPARDRERGQAARHRPAHPRRAVGRRGGGGQADVRPQLARASGRARGDGSGHCACPSHVRQPRRPGRGARRGSEIRALPHHLPAPRRLPGRAGHPRPRHPHGLRHRLDDERPVRRHAQCTQRAAAQGPARSMP